MKNQIVYFLNFLLFTTSIYGCIFKPNGKINVGNTERTFTIHYPKGYSKNKNPFPILFVFHGNPSKGWQMKLYTGMNKTANKNNFIVVYPDALDKKWSYHDCSKVETDIHFVKSLLNQLKSKSNIDSSRIYFCGMSGGGMFISALADTIPEKMAAMSIVAGNKIDPDFGCIENESKISIPFLLIQGTGDFLYNGQEGIFSADQTIDFWIKGINVIHCL